MNSPKNFALGFLALTTVGGAILAWQQYGELVELRAAAMNREERRDSQERISDLERLNRALQDQLAALAGSTNDATLTADAAAERPRGERGERGPRGGEGRGGGPESMRLQAAAIRDLMAKPEVQAMLTAQQKAGIEARYSALFKNLNLSAEQSGKLTTLLAERGNTRRDVEEAARAQGINPRENPEAFRKLFTDAQNDINASIKSVLGEQGYAQLQNYEQTMPQRNLVDNLQQRLATSNAPLSASQAEQLVQILAATTPARTTSATTGGSPTTGTFERGPGFGPPGGGPGGPGGFGGPDLGRMLGGAMGGPGMGPGGPGGGAVVTAAAVAQAQPILAPVQLAALQQIQATQQTQQQLQQMVRDTLAATAAANPTTTAPAGGAPGTNTTGGSTPGGSGRKRPGGE